MRESFKATYGIGTNELEEAVLYALYDVGGTSTRRDVINFVSGYISAPELKDNMGQQVQVRINRARDLGWVVPADQSPRGVWTLTPAGHQEYQRRLAARHGKTAEAYGQQPPVSEPEASGAPAPLINEVMVFQDQDEGYLAWLAKNQEGFVASYEKPSGAYNRLHRASCGTLAHMPAGAMSQTREYFKYCGASIAMVDAAAMDTGLPEATECGTCRPRSGKALASSQTNPPWRREELILALHHYLIESNNGQDEVGPELEALSQELASLPYHGEPSPSPLDPAACKLMLSNFSALELSGPGAESAALSQTDRDIWSEFANDRLGLAREVERIRVEAAALQAPERGQEPDPEEEQYPEGRLYYRMHRGRERSQGLPEKAKKRFRERHGRLFCQACGFDFAETYGELGDGFIEAHHTKPVSQMEPGESTKVADLAMVCSNCHRMLHVGKGLSVEALQARLRGKA